MGQTHPPRTSQGPLRILFVCSGNTCRSPIAEAIARQIVAESGREGMVFRSAGTSTVAGLPASDRAMRASRRHGLSLEAHSSSPLSRTSIDWADLILAMGPNHLFRVLESGGEGKAALLGAFAEGVDTDAEELGVPDPFGGDDEIYEATFLTLEALVTAALDRLFQEEGK